MSGHISTPEQPIQHSQAPFKGSRSSDGVICSGDNLGYETICIQAGGTWNATVNLEVTVDNTTWLNVPLYLVYNRGWETEIQPLDSIYLAPLLAGLKWRINLSNYSSGTVEIKGFVTTASMNAEAGIWNLTLNVADNIEDQLTQIMNGVGGIPSQDYGVGYPALSSGQRVTPATPQYTESIIVVAGVNQALMADGATNVHVRSVNVYNASATIKYIKFWDFVGEPTVGADEPKLTYGIPAGQNFSPYLGNGIYIQHNLSVATLIGIATSSTTGVSANDLVINIGYDLGTA